MDQLISTVKSLWKKLDVQLDKLADVIANKVVEASKKEETKKVEVEETKEEGTING